MMRIILGVFLVVGLMSHGFATCRVPTYKIGRNLAGSKLSSRDLAGSKLSIGSLNVSLGPEDFTISNLACLSVELRSKYEYWNTFSILFFTSQDAAKNFVTPGIEEAPGITERARQLNATYSFDAKKHEEYLDILPFGFETIPEYVTRINLPLGTTPHCRFEINSRCLIALRQIEYPSMALNASTQGTVTLSGVLTSKGKITDIRVTENTVQPQGHARLLSDAAIQNLSTWRLEPAKHQDTIKISYIYRIDSHYNIEFNLPNSIVVSDKP